MLQVIEEFYSPDNLYKAEIREHGDGLLEIIIYKWTHENVPEQGEVCPPFWKRVSGGPSLTDSPVTARSQAKEDLQRFSGTVGFKTRWSRPDLEQEKSGGAAAGTVEGSDLHQHDSGVPRYDQEGLYERVAGFSQFITVLALFLLVSPVVWWFYGPVWAIGTAISSIILFAITPFRGLLSAVLIVNILYCGIILVTLILD